MSEESAGGGLHIDSDWKTEAAAEKERLAEQERKEQEQAKPGPAGAAAGTFVELVNLITMQAAVALGGFQDPGGQQMPPNPAAARHFIDLLEVLQKKTKGNLTDDEQRTLDAVLYELQMQYVQSAQTKPTAPGGTETQA